MANILFAWELGMGLGHTAQIALLANLLAAKGHRVFAALRDLRAGQGLFDPAVIPLPAPFRLGPSATETTLSFASILRDIGFGDERALPVLAAAWRNLFKLVRPDLIVFDHSPTALLASRGLKAKRLLLGVGFCVPPPTAPHFPALRTTTLPDQLHALEEPLLAQANAVLASWNQPSLPHLSALYGGADDTLLTTFPEFDCYRYHRKSGAKYFGPINATGGKVPDWPTGAGKKVFAYLKPFPALKPLLAHLKEHAIPAIICLDRVAPTMREQFACDTLRFETERLDLEQVGQQCDLAICYGAHATSIAMLLAARPTLQLPRFLEHTLNAQAAVRQGAALIAPPDDPKAIVTQLQAMLDSDQYTQRARDFAGRYAVFDPTQQSQHMLEQAELLLRPQEHAVA
jgi:hypothetical protein